MVASIRVWQFCSVLAVCGWSDSPWIYLQRFGTQNLREEVSKPAAYLMKTGKFGLAPEFVSSDSLTGKSFSWELDPDSVRGARLLLSGWSRAEGMSRSPKPWNGAKVMIAMEDSTGAKQSAQLRWPDKSSRWNWTRSRILISTPQNLKSARLVVGLERVTGTASFDSVRIARVAQGIAPARSKNIPIPRYSPDRLRGMTTWNRNWKLDTASLVEFRKAWNGNLIRWHMNPPEYRDRGLQSPRFDYDLAKELDKLDDALPILHRMGIRVVVAPQTFTEGLFKDSAAQSLLIRTWTEIVKRYRNNPGVWGWDLANEPVEDDWQEGTLAWSELADTLARTIRRYDTSKVIVVESGNRASPTAFTNLQPLGWRRGYDIPKLVYSFHFYEPGALTHQGVLPEYPLGATYPGTIAGKQWDKNRLRELLKPVENFQRRYRVPIYVGEFSCARWAPNGSAQRWLKDAIDLFEERGWDWTYHAFREYHAWSVELPENRADSLGRQETDRKRLLLSEFAKNPR